MFKKKTTSSDPVQDAQNAADIAEAKTRKEEAEAKSKFIKLEAKKAKPRRKWKGRAVLAFALATAGVFSYDALADRNKNLSQMPDFANNIVDDLQKDYACYMQERSYNKELEKKGSTHQLTQNIQVKLDKSINPANVTEYVRLSAGDHIHLKSGEQSGYRFATVTTGPEAGKSISIPRQQIAKVLGKVEAFQCVKPPRL